MNRIQKALSLIKENRIDALIVNDPINLFYLTGLALSAGLLLISPQKTHLYVDGRYITDAQQKNPCPVFLQSEKNLESFFTDHAKIGFDSSYFTYDVWQGWAKRIEKWQKEKNLSLSLAPIDLKKLRLIKDPSEIAKMKRAADLTKKGFHHVLSLLKEGISELEIAQEFVIFILKNGAEKTSFDPIVSFGVNTSYPHHKSGNTRLKKNELVYMDLGVVLDSYCSDMTRPFFFGEKDPSLVRIYNTVLSAQKKALSLCKPNTPVGHLDKAAREVMEKENLEEYFLHSLGHGVGLQIHEHPRIKFDGADHKLLLQEGMVITIEPGIYIEGKGGVRYEDTIVITKDGYENFYQDLNA